MQPMQSISFAYVWRQRQCAALYKCCKNRDKCWRFSFPIQSSGSSSAESVRINSSGHLLYGQSSTAAPEASNTISGIGLRPAGEIFASVNGAPAAYFNKTVMMAVS